MLETHCKTLLRNILYKINTKNQIKKCLLNFSYIFLKKSVKNAINPTIICTSNPNEPIKLHYIYYVSYFNYWNLCLDS